MDHKQTGCNPQGFARREPANFAAILLTWCLLLTFAFSGCSAPNSPVGAWHNEELNQLLHFNSDGSVVIRTAAGDFEGTYLFDKGTDEGVITLNGTNISFTVSGNEMLLVNNGAENLFTRGDMEIAAVAAATPVVAETPALTPAASTAPSETATPVPTATAILSPTYTPATSASSAVSEEETQSGESVSATVNPGDLASYNPNPSNLTHYAVQDVVGTWLSDDGTYKRIFYDDGTVESYRVNGTSWALGNVGTYTFNKLTGKGTVCLSSTYAVDFTVEDDTLLWDGLYAYHRE